LDAPSDKCWSHTWGVTELEVRCSESGKLRELLVDGEVVDSEGQPMRYRTWLGAKVERAGREHVVEALVIRTGEPQWLCKLLVDGHSVSGDPEVDVHAGDALKWSDIRTQGRLRFALTRGGKSALFWSPAMMATLSFTGGVTAIRLVVGAITGALAGLLNADTKFQAAERDYQERLSRRGDAEWVGEISVLRRLLSLLLIAVGGLIALIGGLLIAWGGSGPAWPRFLVFFCGIGIIVLASYLRRPARVLKNTPKAEASRVKSPELGAPR
jgi:hypothetical protein